MKIQFKKAISFMLSAVMTVSTLTSLASSAEMGYETDERTVAAEQQPAAGNGLFGSLNYNVPNVAGDEPNEAENPDFIIYKVEHDRDMSSVVVNYHAKEDCTLFVGIYNDEGTQLYSSVTSELTANGDGYAELTLLDVLPEHYLVKAFLVGKMIQEPLSKPKFYNKETQVMQNILSTTTEDFEEDTVVNLDEDENNNFIVLQDEVKEIKLPDNAVEQDEDGRFIFKKCDEISVLQKGDKAVVYAENDIVAFIVEKSEVSGDNIIITPVADADVSEIFKFIKIEINETNETESIDQTESSDQTEPKKAPDPFEPVNLDSPDCLSSDKKQFEFEFTSDKENDRGFYGRLTFEYDLELYYSVSEWYIGVEGSIDASFSLEGEGEIPIYKKGKKTYEVPIIGSEWCGITFRPEVKIYAKGNISISYNRHYEVNCYSNTGSNITPKNDPGFEKFEASLEIGIRFEPHISFKLLKCEVMDFEPYVELKCVINTPLASSLDQYCVRDDCSECVDFNGQLVFGAKGGLLENKYGGTIIDEITFDLGTFHWSRDLSWGWGPCKNKSYKIKIKVVDFETNKPIPYAKVYNLRENKNIEWTADSNGELQTFVKGEKLNNPYYCVTAKTKDDDEGDCYIGCQWVPEEKWDYKGYVTPQEFVISVFIPKEHKTDKEKEKENDSEPEEEEDDRYVTGRLPEFGEGVHEEYTGPYTYYSLDKETGICYLWGNGVLQIPNLDKYGAKKAIVIDPNMKFREYEASSSDEYLPYSYCVGNWESIDLSVMKCEKYPKIPDNLFAGHEELKEVFLPETLTRIGKYAFMDCTALKHIDIPDGVVILDYCAFQRSGLTSVTCPKSLKIMCEKAFNYCADLREVKLNDGLECIGEYAFRDSGIQSINIPSSVKEIGVEAVDCCKNLKTVVINSDFKRIHGDPVTVGLLFPYEELLPSDSCGIFNGASLEKVIFGEGVTTIAPYSFNYCHSIKSVKLPETLESIGDCVFTNCNITDLKIPDNVSYIGKSAFMCCKITDLKLSEKLAYIGDFAFECCPIEHLELPASIAYLGEGVFDAANSLKSITINSNKFTYSEKRTPIQKYYSGSTSMSGPITVYGHDGSTAEKLAELTNNTFVSLDKPAETPSVTTTVSNTSTTTTTTTTTTTVTTVVTTVVAADTECVFIAIRDAATAVAESYELLDVNNVAYFDQQTADSDGKVSFSYIPDEKEEWTFIFVGEAVNDVVTRTVGTLDGLKKTRYYEDEPIVSGDANGDGEVDMSDIVLIMQSLANPNKYGVDGTDPSHLTKKGSVFADADENGLTVNDALRIQLYLLNKISSLD